MSVFQKKRNRRGKSKLGYGQLENRQLLCSGPFSTSLGVNGVGSISVSGEGACLVINTDTDNSLIVNGENLTVEIDDFRELTINGDGAAGQTVEMGGLFDTDTLEKLTVRRLSEIAITGHYEVSGDLIIDAPQATGNLFQDADATLIVGGKTSINYSKLAAFFSGTNDFQGAVSYTGEGLAIGAGNDLLFGNVTGALFVSSLGDINQVGGTSIRANGISQLTASGDVNLPNGNNDFKQVHLTGNNFFINDRNAIELGQLNTTGSVEVKAGGDITIPVKNQYEFNETLASSDPDGLPLQAIGTFTINGAGNDWSYHFKEDEGLLLNTGLVQEDYFIEMDVAFGEEEIPNKYNKLLDFKNRTSDNGLYLRGDQLRFYGTSGAADTRIVPGQTHTIGLQRSNGIVTSYLDGVKQFAFVDDGQIATYELLHFFLDDVDFIFQEAIPGVADEIRVTQREFAVGSDLKLDASGDVDLAGAIISVPRNLSVKANDVKIVAKGDIKLREAVVRGNSEISTVGRIFQTGPSVQFLGNSIFNASGNINLGRPANNFVGAVSVVGENAILADANNIRFDAIKVNVSATVSAGNFISNTDGATLLGRQGNFSASEIRLGNRTGDDVRFNAASLDSQRRTIYHADDTIRLTNLSAESVFLSSTKAIFDTPDASINVRFNAKFVAPNSISLGDSPTDNLLTGQVTLQSDGYVGFTENSNLQFIGNNYGRFMSIDAAGAVTDTVDASINGRNGIRIAANSVRLGDAPTNNFKAKSTTLQVRGNAFINQASDVLLTGTSVVDGDLILTTSGKVFDTFSSFLAVLGHMHVKGNLIYIGDSLTSHLSASSFSFNSETNATVLLSSETLFGRSSFAKNAFVFANGSIGNQNGAMLNVPGRTKLEALSIKIGDKPGDSFRTSQVEFKSRGRVDMAFDRGVVIAGNSEANSLRLVTNQFIRDAFDSQLKVTGHSRFIATNVMIGERTTDSFETSTLSFSASGTVVLHEDNNMRLAGPSNANRIVLKSTGSITDSADAKTMIVESALLRGTNLIIGDLSSDCFSIAAGASGLTTFGNNVNVTLGC